MDLQPDFKELLALFNAHRVDYVIVGAYALAYHGVPRLTGDLDLLVRPESDNAAAILRALTDFGFGSLGLSEADFTGVDRVVQLGVPPVRIDLLTSITGVSWDEAIQGSAQGHYGDVSVRFLGLEELRRNKRALGRKRDLADLEALEE